ncbi:carboxypeptidase-like regulatory domain-containing protein [Flavobacterium succinicans]|uniref:TonB-dependent receptor SusC n=1 Tax=Flavobacterium succinicans TaxID=29536 RepID=A0A199XQ18_9FLAO|nr:carboxypeptidase-like regulatory domain-containing protein [Flavobacterium succinicans]OAZ03351.1 TonB-dependent receptor SusC precursor [Flavobacterium succinicans]
MRNKYWIWMLLFAFQCSFSKLKGVVKDSISGQPIPYVNIWAENENIGTTSELDGTFTINTTSDKILVFSALGFAPKKIKADKIESVVLKNEAIALNEVIIAPPKHDSEIVIGNYKKGLINHYFACGTSPFIVAKFFPFTKEMEQHSFLKNLQVLTKAEKENAKFVLRFFEVNPDGSPGNDLTAQNIIVPVKKGKKNTEIDLESYKIKVPSNGFFVAVEWLIIDDNRFEFKFTKVNEGSKRFDGVYYDPRIGTIPSEETSTWTYYKGKWRISNFKNSQTFLDRYKDKYLELAMKLTLTN